MNDISTEQTTTDDATAYEQTRVDAAYLLAEERVESLTTMIEDGVPGAHNHSANLVEQRFQDRVDQLQGILENRALMVYGRVDIATTPEAGDFAGETFYVGPAALHDETDPQMIAWESPVATAFRDPTGWRGGQAVAARRQFQGEDRRLSSVLETVYVDGQPEPGSGDPLLDILDQRQGGELHEVVATIRQDQFALMEEDAAVTMVIQGGPGTGKTIVGLHRLSVLMFRSQGDIREGDVLVVTPSETLAHYIRNVLPELGRFAIDHRPISRVGAHGVETRRHDTREVAAIKGRPEMADIITAYLDRGIKPPTGDFEVIPGVVIAAADIGSDFQEANKAGTYAAKRSRLRDLVGLRTAGRVDRKTLDSAIDDIFPGPSEKKVINEILSSPRVLPEIAPQLTDAEQAAILRAPTAVKKTPWTHEDVPLLDEAAWQLRGTERVGQRFKHIVVDEAQDLSPMQLRVIGRRVAPEGGCTFLGDLAQATQGWALRSWKDHLADGGIAADRYAELTLGYRIPREQLDFAGRLLGVIDVDVAATTSVIPDDDEAEPCIMRSSSQSEMLDEAMDVVATLLDEEANSVALGVIGPEDELRAFSDRLEKRYVSYTWAAKSTSFPVTLVPVDDAKGLEFDHVVVLEPAKVYRSHPIVGPRLLYVALTRSRGTLSLVHTTALPPILTGSHVPPPQAEPLEIVTSPVGSPAAVATEQRHLVRFGDSLYQVTWRPGGAATVEDLPMKGGVATLVAQGFVVAAEGSLAWALAPPSGPAVAIETAVDPSEAATTVAAVIDESRHGGPEPA